MSQWIDELVYLGARTQAPDLLDYLATLALGLGTLEARPELGELASASSSAVYLSSSFGCHRLTILEWRADRD